MFRQNRVDGVILLASIFTELHRSLLSKMRVPTVIVGQKIKGFNCVCHNDLGAAYAMTKLMLDKGAVRPGFIGANPEDNAAGRDRRLGFEKALADAGIPVQEKFMAVAKFNMDQVMKGGNQQLFSGILKPEPCFRYGQHCRQRRCSPLPREPGLRIPEDVMIGVTAIPASESSSIWRCSHQVPHPGTAPAPEGTHALLSK